MPTDFRISELPTSASFDNLDLMEVSQVDPQSVSGYTSIKKTMNQLGDKLNNDIQYAADLNTTDKKIIGAINELLSAINDVADDIPTNSDFSLSGLSDTNIDSSTAVGQVIAFNGTKWINSNSFITLNNKVNQFTDWTTSTTSFTDACSKLGIYSGIGAVLDSLKTTINSYTNSTINNKVDISQGPNFFMIFGKANDSYFTGILLSYFYSDSSRQPIMFTYSNGTYVVKKI